MKCNRCQQEFKSESLLKRHQSRKTPCEKKLDVKHEHCKYCKKPVCSIQSKSRHEQICKYKDDFVRNLELELDIDIIYEYSSTMCRFCNKSMRSDTLIRHESSCKKKEVYKTKLQTMLHAHKSKQKCESTTIHNNITNNTHNGDVNNNINIILKPFGSENLDYVTPSSILKLLKQGKCQFSGEAEKHRFLRLIFKYIHANPEHPENHNMLIPSLKGSNALVYTHEGFENIHRKIAENQVLNTIADVTYDALAIEHDEEAEELSRQKCQNNYEKFVKKYIEGENSFDNESDQRINAKNRHIVGQTSYDCKTIIKETHKIAQ